MVSKVSVLDGSIDAAPAVVADTSAVLLTMGLQSIESLNDNARSVCLETYIGIDSVLILLEGRTVVVSSTGYDSVEIYLPVPCVNALALTNRFDFEDKDKVAPGDNFILDKP